MKRPAVFMILLLAAAAALVLHTSGAREEGRLKAEVKAARGALSPQTGPEGKTRSRFAKQRNGAAEERAPSPAWTAEEAERFLALQTAETLAEEKRLLETGGDPFQKLAPFEERLKTLAPGELYAVCLRNERPVFFNAAGMNTRSNDEEIRGNLFMRAYGELKKRDPFLALRLPFNRPGTKEPNDIAGALSACAAVDPAAAWREVEERYGGKEAPAFILSGAVEGAAGEDAAAQIAQAREWGILDRMLDTWPAEASKTGAAQQAWLEAVREVSPANADDLLAKFTAEVETTEGFAGARRIIGEIAKPGAALYDRLLTEAAARDLEEEAAPKADWILANVSPAGAAAAAETLMKHWTEADPLSASEWLNTVPREAPWRGAAVPAFARVIEPHDPEAAARWRETAPRR